MKVFIFDLLAYGKHFDQYKESKYLPYPLGNDHYDREVAAQTYEQHLQAWEEMDKLGFDGVGLNEHHTTPHGLMNSPNMMAAVAAQRTKKLKFLMLGNLVPLHNPLRIAEELAMADTMSRGRILSGFARGVPREYNVYGVPMAALLGILTGLLAFLPNIGAPISGLLMVMVGFSGGTAMGVYCIIVYFVVQTVDGNIIVPMVAKRTADLAPALVLGAQLIFGVLFGILGLALADPIVAMLKIALERQAERNKEVAATEP